MNRRLLLMLCALRWLGAQAGEAPQAVPDVAPAAALPTPTVAASVALPAMVYVGSVAGDELYRLLKAEPLFANLSDDLPGAPITLRVTHTTAMTGGGKAAVLASAIFAGGTLGLLPFVTNNDLVITYEVLANGVVVTTYSYTGNFTQSKNIYSTDTTHGLGKEGLAWAKGTVAQFVTAAATDEKLHQLAAEYDFYYRNPAVH